MHVGMLSWEGYDDPDVLAPFERERNCRVRVDTHLSDFAAAQRVLRRDGAWDLVNINSPFVRDALAPRGTIRALDPDRFGAVLDTAALPSEWRPLAQWGIDPGGAPIGVCQRFGPFNLVVDSDAVSVAMAEDQGFALAADPRNAGRYGILAYDDFNVLHIALASGFDPFIPVGDAECRAFAATAQRWFSAARMVTGDHVALNRALVSGAIDFYLGGGIYTASCARLEGHARVRAITPRHGPVGGKGAIAFVEVNAALAFAAQPAEAEAFLAYLLRPEAAARAALAGGAANPVLQMRDPAVFAAIGRDALEAMQWDTLDADLGRCLQYGIVPGYERLHALLLAARVSAGRLAIRTS